MSIKNRIGSPSARRREHVRGRWNYRADLNIGNERTIHAAKQVIGFLIPSLMVSLPIFLATSRAATEIASWGLAALTLLYIGLDAFARHREFKFFRLGPDLALAACFGFGMLSVAASLVSSTTSSDLVTSLLEGLGQLRWIPLLYLLVYAWELFPGLNRVMFALMGTVTVTAILTWVQHFQGVDWLTGEALKNAPTGLHPFFVPRGFFGSTEALATLFACTLPFPVAAACLRRDRDETDKMTWIGFGLSVLIALALAFTYRPGFWWAGAAGAAALLLFPGDRRFKLLFSMALAIASVWFLLFVAFENSNDESGSASTLLNRIEGEENRRAEQHRIQMNRLVAVWENSPILGIAGSTADIELDTPPVAGNTDDVNGEFQYESVNVYFLILARGGLIGLILYLGFILHHLLNTLRLFHEIPESHHKHRVLVAGCFASQCAFHAAGLYWGTMTEAFSMNLFVLVCSMTLYMNEHYAHGIVSDDSAL